MFLLAGLLLPLCTFMVLAWMVSNAVTVPFDAPVLLAVHETASPILDSVFLLISSLGYGFGLVPFDVLFTLWLAFKRRWRDSIFALVALGGSFGLNTLAKHAFERTRPHLWDPIPLEGTYSFPSGHAMASATLGFVLVALATRTQNRPLLIAVAATLVLPQSPLSLGCGGRLGSRSGLDYRLLCVDRPRFCRTACAAPNQLVVGN